MAKLRVAAQRIRTVDTRAVKPPPKTADPFYLSAAWRALMDQLIEERGRRCEDPEHDPARPRAVSRVFGDHIDELADDGAPLDPANVMLRCGSCHTRKTARARAHRMAARPPAGPA